jgi:hypothetical protein
LIILNNLTVAVIPLRFTWWGTFNEVSSFNFYMSHSHGFFFSLDDTDVCGLKCIICVL